MLIRSLGSYRGSPFAAGGWPGGLETEILNYGTNTWVQGENYPFSNNGQYVFSQNKLGPTSYRLQDHHSLPFRSNHPHFVLSDDYTSSQKFQFMTLYLKWTKSGIPKNLFVLSKFLFFVITNSQCDTLRIFSNVCKYSLANNSF